MALQHLRVIYQAAGGSGSIWNGLGTLLQLIEVCWSIVYGLLPMVNFADEIVACWIRKKEMEDCDKRGLWKSLWETQVQ